MTVIRRSTAPGPAVPATTYVVAPPLPPPPPAAPTVTTSGKEMPAWLVLGIILMVTTLASIASVGERIQAQTTYTIEDTLEYDIADIYNGILRNPPNFTRSDVLVLCNYETDSRGYYTNCHRYFSSCKLPLIKQIDQTIRTRVFPSDLTELYAIRTNVLRARKMLHEPGARLLNFTRIVELDYCPGKNYTGVQYILNEALLDSYHNRFLAREAWLSGRDTPVRSVLRSVLDASVLFIWNVEWAILSFILNPMMNTLAWFIPRIATVLNYIGWGFDQFLDWVAYKLA